MRMEFLISIPTSAIMPMIATKPRVSPVTKSASRAPTMPSGTTLNTMSVDLNVRNSNTSTPRIPNTARRMTPPMPPVLSSLLSFSPASSMR